MKKLLFSVVFTLLIQCTIAQGVSINPNGADPDTSAMLDVGSNSKGFLVPRMTSAQRDAIPLPATGLLVFSTTTTTFDYYTGSGWVSLSVSNVAPTPTPIIRTYTSDTTWTKPAGLKYIVVEMVGGGGGGGGALIGSSTSGGGGGGAGGGYSKKLIAASILNSNELIMVGIGGLGGDIGTDGTRGGISSFGSHCEATGGWYGEGTNPGGLPGSGGLGGLGNNGDINSEGQGGSAGTAGGGSGVTKHSGSGGSSMLGGGARGFSSDGISITGIVGGNYGGGGSGGFDNQSSASVSGGSGAHGVVIVTEHY
jgi:hypothetical protein